MSEPHRTLDREKLREAPTLRKEWVSIAAGDVCVWGMKAADMLMLGERIQRPSIDPRGGIDTTAAVVWMILLCTHETDAPNSPLVWTEPDIAEIYQLSGEDFAALSQACQRVNGTDGEGLDRQRDFTRAPEAPNSSDSPSSASSSSAGSRPNLEMSAITNSSPRPTP